jgi:hypothetical protein
MTFIFEVLNEIDSVFPLDFEIGIVTPQIEPDEFLGMVGEIILQLM